MVRSCQLVSGPSSRLWLERTPALPPEHLRRLIGAAALSAVPSQKRIPILPPKHPRREGGCLNNEELLVRGWKILFPRLLQYRVSHLLAKRKKRRTRWLTLLIILARGSTNGVQVSSKQLMLPPRLWMRLSNTQSTGVQKSRR